MATKGVADIVFCIDASASMAPCFKSLQRHITHFLTGLHSNPQMTWDWRLDFVAHRASAEGASCIHQIQSAFNECAVTALYKDVNQGGRFFTTDIKAFSSALDNVEICGDEAPLVALDCCLDFPWRQASNCHRVIIFLTDEPFETSAYPERHLAVFDDLVKKIQDLRVMLFIVAPESDAYDGLSAVDKSEYEVIENTNDGLSSVDFSKVLSYIGKSVSVSTLQQPKNIRIERGLYGQDGWGAGAGSFSGR